MSDSWSVKMRMTRAGRSSGGVLRGPERATSGIQIKREGGKHQSRGSVARAGDRVDRTRGQEKSNGNFSPPRRTTPITSLPHPLNSTA